MRIAILSANLGSFDNPIDPVKQDVPEGVIVDFHRWTDENFPPIAGLTPRLQYRIPKLFGWEMFPDYDYYFWLDGGMSLQRPDCIKWYLEQIGNNDMLLFRHPWRGTIREEVDHIEQKLQQSHPYITPRYKNGLHKEQYEVIKNDLQYKDDALYATTAFFYKNNYRTTTLMEKWWFYQSRYYTCDQVVLPWLIKKSDIRIAVIKDSLFKIGYMSLVSHHNQKK